LRHEEWAENAEDILWRRSKLGLSSTDEEAAALDQWLARIPSLAMPV
jgi:glycerol-3-phosphate dehydrogenase